MLAARPHPARGLGPWTGGGCYCELLRIPLPRNSLIGARRRAGALCSGPCAPVTEHPPPYITWGERRSLHTLHHAELAPYGSIGIRLVVDVNVVVAGVLPYGRAQRTRYRLPAAGSGALQGGGG